MQLWISALESLDAHFNQTANSQSTVQNST